MLKDQIVNICLPILATVSVLFVVVKVVVLKRSKVKKSNQSKAFIKSLLPVSKQQRKNMTNTRLANFYARSNDVNFFYYIIAVLIIGTYLLLSSIN